MITLWLEKYAVEGKYKLIVKKGKAYVNKEQKNPEALAKLDQYLV